MKSGFQAWREAVTDRVRFWPDRDAIAQELTAHYEDHVKDLERLGYGRSLAEERSLAAMGDPQEVGRAMDRVHKPWLGWLWEVSRAVLVIAVVVLVGWGLMDHLGSWARWTAATISPPDDIASYQEHMGSMRKMNEESDGETWTLGGSLTGETIRAGDYTVSMVEGSWWEWKGKYCRAFCVLRLEPDHIWYGQPSEIYDDLRLTTSHSLELVNNAGSLATELMIHEKPE